MFPSLKILLREPSSKLIRYLLPLMAWTAALGFQLALRRFLSPDFPFALFYLLAIFGVAWFGGYGPGIISCFLTIGILPALTTSGFQLSSIDLSRLVPLIGISLLISKVARTERRAREVLGKANDELDLLVQRRTEDLRRTVGELEQEVSHHQKTELKLQIQVERLNLLDQITRAIGERQDLKSIFQVVIRSLEDRLPIDFGCICLYDPAREELTVTSVGINSSGLAMDLAMTEQAHVPIDQNGLSRCVRGELVYEPNLNQVHFPFPQRLVKGGLQCAVIAPLQVESQVFGVLVASRRAPEAFSSTDCEFLRQLTEHVALASNQAQVYGALTKAYDDLRQTQQIVMQQERLRSLGQMASGIAHDINNAISPVSLYMELLLEREPNLSARTREYLETTQRAIGDVAHTVARMREFYKEREPQLMLLPVDLNSMAQQVLDLTRARWCDIPQARGTMIRLESNLAAELPSVAGIESEVREALTNLVFNAVDAMPNGGTLTVRTERTQGLSDQPQVSIEISDTGIGMDEDTRRRCLEPFFTTKGERGTGLGLAMVYGVTKRHNAEINIESAPGKGTRVLLRFPIPVSWDTQKPKYSSAAVPTRQRILIVDDDPLLIRSLRDTLEADGHTVTAANGGQEGIDAFRAAEERREPFAVVITDLGMPYIDGRKVASAVKSTRSSTPVVLLTGWGQRLVAEGEVPEHVDCVLSKPPKLRDLRAALVEVAGVQC